MNNVGERSSSPAAPGADTSLVELRRVLVGVEQRQIAHLTERLDDPIIRAQETANVLVDAVRVRTARDGQLTEALQPTISTALEQAVTHDPRPFANALFPVLGPAIRAAVTDMLSRALASLDAALTNTFSVQGLRWRMEAWRTGRSFAEVVLLRTLVYRVEQLILIDRMTGLPLQHLMADDLRSTDAAHRSAMMSGMLAALRDYAHDALGARSNESLDAFTVGDLKVWVEQGPRVLLAAVIRGVPPEEMRVTLRECGESLQLQFGAAFARFDGDAAPFVVTRPTLERVFAAKYSAGAKPKSMARAWTVVAIVFLTLLGVAGWWWYRGARFGDYVERLRAEPGIVITEAERDGLGFRVAGLRDPNASAPAMLRLGIPLDTARLTEQWAPYLSLDSTITLLRTVRRVQPPARVSLTLRGDTIEAAGSATGVWRESALVLALSTPGVRVWRDSALVLDVRARADSLAQLVSTQPLTFGTGASVLRPAERERLRVIAAQVRELSLLVPVEGGVLEVSLAGFTDPSGSDTLNTRLARERAAVVRAALVEEGVADSLLLDRTTTPSAEARSAAQRVTAVQATVRWELPPSRSPAPPQ